MVPDPIERIPQSWLFQVLGWLAYAGFDFVLLLSLFKDPSSEDRGEEVIAHGVFIGSLLRAAGLGRSNSMECVRVLLGADHRFVVPGPPEGGCRIEIELPFKEVSATMPVANGETTCVS